MSDEQSTGQEESKPIRIKIYQDEIELGADEFAVDSKEIPEQIFHYGVLLARAERQKLEIECEYQEWRALEGKATVIKRKTLPEWKIKMWIRSCSQYITFKKAAALVESNIWTLKAMLSALQARLDLVAPSRNR